MRLTDEHRAYITWWIRENMLPGDELTTDQIADLEALLESEREWMEEAKRNRWAVSLTNKRITGPFQNEKDQVQWQQEVLREEYE